MSETNETNVTTATAPSQPTPAEAPAKPNKPKKSKKKLLTIAAIAAVVVIAAILLFSGGDKTQYTEEVVKQQDIITYYSFDGNIQAADTQQVLSTTTMPVKTFHVKEGDLVEEGDLLLNWTLKR